MGLNIYLYFEIDTGATSNHDYAAFDANITHNLGKMADAAAIYQCLWHPEEDSSVNCAGDLIEKLQLGIALMKNDPERFRAFDSPNGWGTYDDFVPWLERLLRACIEFPKAKIRVSL